MKRILFALLAACLLTGCSLAPTSPSTSAPTVFPARETLTGMWVGTATDSNSATQSVFINFAETDPTLNIEPLTQVWNMSLTQTDEVVNFSATGKPSDPFQKIEFNGALTNGALTGTFNWDGTTSALAFAPIVSVEASQLEKYEGVYRFDSGRSVSVIVSPPYEQNGLRFFAEGLTFTDFSTGDSRALYAFDESTFAIGALRTTGQPFVGRVQFVSDEAGNVTGLMQWDSINSSAAPELAQRVNFTQEVVTYISADGTVLAGLVSTPESESPVPAIVALHGSEAGTKDNFGNKIMAHYMLSQGIAILNFDKRGAGDSGGRYVESSDISNLTLLAQDVVAGVELMAARPSVDATRIGLIGGSQAGWVIPLAAELSSQVAYFVIQSGPVVSTFQEDIYSGVTNDGDSQTAFDADALNQRIRNLHPGGFDPVPVLAKLNQPGLWLWGDVDLSQPTMVGAENLQKMIDDGKNNFSYVIFPQGDHNLNFSAHGLFDEIPFAPRVVYFQALTEWLEKFILANG